MIRTFIALPITDEVKKALANIILKLKPRYSEIKWVRPESIHLTLKFLGNIDERLVKDISSGLDKIVQDYPILGFGLKGLGVFPNKTRPRVVWCGLEGDIGTASSLAVRIDAMCERFGIEKETRPFRAHLTLGRLKIPAMIEVDLNIEEVKFSVHEVVFYRSELQRDGAKYTVLHKCTLGAKGG